MMIIDPYRFGSLTPNLCGTGAIAPLGWEYLHSEISGGLGSWGNMIKVEGFNSKGATVENVTDGSLDVCYKDGEIDKSALDSFFTANADVKDQYDQFGLNDLNDGSINSEYNKSANDLNKGGSHKISSFSGSLSSLKNSDSWTICIVIDSIDTPTVNQLFNPISFGTSDLQAIWSGNNTSLILRFGGPNQGYFYNGLRSSGTKLLIITYDGTSPINRSGLNLYWNGSTTAETPAGSYNSGAPASNQVLAEVALRNWRGDSYAKELDIFDSAFGSTEILAAKSAYEQLYTFS